MMHVMDPAGAYPTQPPPDRPDLDAARGTPATSTAVGRGAAPGPRSRLRAYRRRGPDPTHRRLLLLLALIVATVGYVWPRTWDLDRVVTVDEPVFLSISANFANAVVHGELAETSQFLYPAVTIMWAGMTGLLIEVPAYVRDQPGQLTALKSVHEPIRAVGGDPLAALVAARLAKLALQAAGFLIALWLMHRLFGRAVTALAAVFIVFDPFLIAHDQLLHVDGMTGITAFATMLAVAQADRTPTRMGLWVLAGILAALCWLTRLTGLVLLPIILLVIVDGAISRYRRRAQAGNMAVVTAARAAAAVVGASVVTTIGLWPALWVAPGAALRETLAEWQRSIETPHPWGLYFAGETITGDPGLLFYVVVVLYKLTPFTLVGLAVMAVAALFRLDPIVPRRDWRPIVILLSFVMVYSLGMAAGTRKFDRYVLPDFLFLDLLAAIGIVGVARLAWARRHALVSAAAGLALGGLVAGQVLLALAQRPYPLVYYNPLFGGTATAEELLMVGWGEGLDQAARVILTQPEGETAMVRTSIHPTTMLYFLPETVKLGHLFLGANREGLFAWATTDYAVTHVLQWNRDTFGGVISYLAGFEPLHTVTIDGVEFARVYDLRDIPPPAWMVEQGGCGWLFDGKVTLATFGQQRPDADERRDPNEQVVTLAFQTRIASGLPAEYHLRGVLVPRHQHGTPILFATSFAPAARRGLLATARQTVRLPAGSQLDDYRLRVTVIDPATGQAVSARDLTSSPDRGRPEPPGCLS